MTFQGRVTLQLFVGSERGRGKKLAPPHSYLRHFSRKTLKFDSSANVKTLFPAALMVIFAN